MTTILFDDSVFQRDAEDGGGEVQGSSFVPTWGSPNIPIGDTVQYLSYGGIFGIIRATPVYFVMPVAGRLSQLIIRHNVPGTTSTAISYTCRVNNVASALTATLAANATTVTNAVDSIAVAAGDLIDIQVTKAVYVGTPVVDIMAVALFVAD